ncbi:MAG: hypothetical protein ACFFKA_22250 [Candidatus Thorarchaeota archaeon]
MIHINIDENGGFEKLDVIKRYFYRIFTVLSKEVREQLTNLNLSKDELKEVKKELAFLSEEKQKEFLNELAKNDE